MDQISFSEAEYNLKKRKHVEKNSVAEAQRKTFMCYCAAGEAI